MNVSHPIEPVTPEEFERMDKDERLTYELIDGVVLMSPRPSLEHQKISGNLYFELRKALANQDCTPIQEVELVLNGSHLVPDLIVVCNEPLIGKHYDKAPLIVMEIVSPSSTSRDYITKRYKYESLGIREYWIISPEEKCNTVFDFASAAHEMYCSGQVKSWALPEVQIELNDIFA